MNDIIFRGKRIIDNNWVYGYFVKSESNINNGKCYILSDFHSFNSINDWKSQIGYFQEVIPETVGMYTGLKDKNEVKIFERDILIDEYGDLEEAIWGEGAFFFKERKEELRGYEEYCEVVGNIYNKN